MIDSSSALANALSGTPLADRTVIDLPILDTGQSAFAIEITPAEIESAWRVAHGLVGHTGRVPLVVTSWSGSQSAAGFENGFRNEDLFMRFPYEQCTMSSAADATPAAILRAADAVDVPAFVESLAVRRDRLRPLQKVLDLELDATRYHLGSAPTKQDVQHARLDGRPITTAFDLDRFLLDWERNQGALPAPSDARQPWFDPGIASLLFMPTTSSWDCLAYIHWWGMFAGAERYIALGREWSRRFGAELVAHYGTMLQCLVSSPPATVEVAWELGRQHDLIAPCTLALPGIHLRHYAAGLCGYDRWFLHERP
jgi:hypothetical protein